MGIALESKSIFKMKYVAVALTILCAAVVSGELLAALMRLQSLHNTRTSVRRTRPCWTTWWQLPRNASWLSLRRWWDVRPSCASSDTSTTTLQEHLSTTFRIITQPSRTEIAPLAKPRTREKGDAVVQPMLYLALLYVKNI